MEKNLKKTYNTAYEELSKEWNSFMQKQEPKVKKAYQDLQEALKTGDTQTIFDARVYYERVMMNTTIQNNRYKAMVDKMTDNMAHVNEIALDYVNENMPYVYTINYNQFSRENIKGYSFNLINENAVKELMVTDQMLVPTKKLDIPKDKAWNTKFINSQVTQGILQGESIDKIAKRILPEIASKSEPNLISRNRNSAIRNARTMTTAAENKGRQDSFKKAQSDGVIMTRTWVATHDERTRAWHSDMDGVETAIDEPWENDYGEIMFPGDPAAHPANVYNCRCSIRAHVKGFDWNKKLEKTIESVVESDKNIKPGEMVQNVVNKITKKQSDPITTNIITEKLEKAGVKRVPVSKYDTIPSMQNIIDKVSGGDETGGSCLSAAYTYCAQRNGLDALDFRGGKSREIFSHLSEDMAKLFNGTITRGFNELEVALEALKGIEKNQEYVLAAGRHAAVVKKTGKYYQYLELQNPDLHYNRWCPLDQSSLKSRFSCDPNDNEDGIIVSLVSRNSLKDNKDFESILEYINTNEKKQKKGSHGSIK